MVRHHSVIASEEYPNGEIPFTDQEEMEANQRDAEYIANAPARERRAALPVSVTRYQIKKRLQDMGKLDAVKTSMSGASEEIKLDWSDRGRFDIDSPLIIEIGIQMQLSQEQIDSFLIDASKVV